MEKSELLQEIDKAYRELMGAYTALSEETIESVPIDGHWTIRDYLVHISQWHQWGLDYLDRFARGEAVVFIAPDVQATNDAAVDAQQGVNMVQLMDHLTTEYRRTRQAVMRFSPAQLQEPWDIQGSQRKLNVIKLMAILTEHDREHAEQIRQWRQANGA